jgi:hypothetical protein
MFSNRKLLIATQHGKEKVMAPLLTTHLQVHCHLAEHFDTDTLGTFTGEIERKDNPMATLRKKCKQAMALYNETLCIASEGSFGPHPQAFFLAADEELVLLTDTQHHLEIFGHALSTETNFSAATLYDEDELWAFASQALFPSHALILRNSANGFDRMVKGITDKPILLKTFNLIKHEFGSVYAETDMRACYNPSRMKVIEQAVKNLISNCKSCCPQCNAPGFAATAVIKGLPCNWCGNKTESVMAHVYTCHQCNHKEEKYFPHGKTTEDPTYCNCCNP